MVRFRQAPKGWAGGVIKTDSKGKHWSYYAHVKTSIRKYTAVYEAEAELQEISLEVLRLAAENRGQVVARISAIKDRLQNLVRFLERNV